MVESAILLVARQDVVLGTQALDLGGKALGRAVRLLEGLLDSFQLLEVPVHALGGDAEDLALLLQPLEPAFHRLSNDLELADLGLDLLQRVIAGREGVDLEVHVL